MTASLQQVVIIIATTTSSSSSRMRRLVPSDEWRWVSGTPALRVLFVYAMVFNARRQRRRSADALRGRDTSSSKQLKPACLRLPTSADNVALPAFAAARPRRAAAAAASDRVGPVAVHQSIDISWSPGPQQQTRSSGVRRPDETDWQWQTPDSCIDTAPHTLRASPIIDRKYGSRK